MPGPFTIIRTANRNYWREGLENKEETSSTKFCCRSRTGAAQSRERCGKDGADARYALVRVGKRKGRREEALRSGKQFAKQPLRLAQSLLGEHDRLGFADRVSD